MADSHFVDPEKRQRRKDYVGLTEADERRLRELGPRMAEYLDGMVDGFYRHLLRFDELRRFLSDDLIAGRLRAVQKVYLQGLFGGEYAEDYFQGRFRIGQVHEHLKIPLTSYLGAYSQYLSMFFSHLCRNGRDDPEASLPFIQAVTRAVFLDMDLALEAYIEAGHRELSEANARLSHLTHQLDRDLDRRTADLQMAEARFQSVFENAAVALLTYDQNGRIFLANRACTDLFGLPLQGLQESTLQDLLDPVSQRGKTREILASVFDGHGVTAFVWEVPDAGRGLHYIEGTTFPVRHPDGRIPYAIWWGQDVTERQRMKEALARTEKLAAMGILASGVAHEIGTPMNVILGRAESLLRSSREEKTEKGLKIIIEQVERISRSMERLLAFVRRKPAERRPSDLKRIIARTVEMVREEAQGKGVEIEATFDFEDAHIRVDPDQMEQVLLNLTLNAIQAMPGGGPLRIAVLRTLLERRRMPRPGSQSKGCPMMEIRISDTGIGIQPEDLRKIFDPFFTTKPVGQGTGLGLTVTQSIVRDHGGEILVESEVGRGTTVRVLIPAGDHALP